MYLGHSVAVASLIILSFTLSVDCRRYNGKWFRNRLKFLHVSDFHFDPLYDKSTDESTWCRRFAESNSSAAYEAPYGRIGCDSPEELLTITLAGMKEKGNDAKFIILSGIKLVNYVPLDGVPFLTFQSEIRNDFRLFSAILC